jgi:hypothetical protein
LENHIILAKYSAWRSDVTHQPIAVGDCTGYGARRQPGFPLPDAIPPSSDHLRGKVAVSLEVVPSSTVDASHKCKRDLPIDVGANAGAPLLLLIEARK